MILPALRSWLLARHIEIVRMTDHSWRMVTGRPRASRSMITPELYLGGQYRRRSSRWFVRQGITAIVSMRMHPPIEFGDLPEIKIRHLPTPDFQASTLSQFREGTAFIRTVVEQGGRVYVHCHHGEGRGPSMAAAYLMSTGLSLADALRAIRQVRSFIRPTRAQLTRLQEWAIEVGVEPALA